MPARTLGPEGWVDCDTPHQLEREEQVLERMLGPEGGWIVRSHVDWRGERVPARTLGPEGGEL